MIKTLANDRLTANAFVSVKVANAEIVESSFFQEGRSGPDLDNGSTPPAALAAGIESILELTGAIINESSSRPQ